MKEFARGLILAAGLLVVGVLVCFAGGCSSPAVSEPVYPEYDKWWARSVNTNSLDGLGQGDVYVHEFVTTNYFIYVPGNPAGVRWEVVTNRMEAVLL